MLNRIYRYAVQCARAHCVTVAGRRDPSRGRHTEHGLIHRGMIFNPHLNPRPSLLAPWIWGSTRRKDGWPARWYAPLRGSIHGRGLYTGGWLAWICQPHDPSNFPVRASMRAGTSPGLVSLAGAASRRAGLMTDRRCCLRAASHPTERCLRAATKSHTTDDAAFGQLVTRPNAAFGQLLSHIRPTTLPSGS